MEYRNPFRSHPILTSLGSVLVVLVVAFGVCEWMGWPFLRGPLERFLDTRLERRVEVGPAFRMHTLGELSVRSDRLAIGPPRWAAQPDERFFEARDVTLRLPWSTLWHLATSKEPQPLHVRSLEVGGFDALLWRRADGRANWDFASHEARAGQGRIPEFEHLMVRDGHLQLDDAPTDVHLKADASTEEGTAGGREAGLRIKGDGRYREGQFSFTMHSNGVLPLVAPEGSSVAVPVTLQAHTPNLKLKFDGQAQDVVHLEALNGRFVVSGTSLAKAGKPFGVTLPTTAAFEMEGKLGKSGQVWKANVGRFEVGSSRLAGDFTFDRRPSPPLLTGVLRGRNLDLADLGPALGAPAPGAGHPSKPAGKVLPDRSFDIPSLKMMNADVRVDLQQADLHTAYLEPLTPLRGRIGLHDGVLTVDQLLARMSGGEIQGQLGLDGRNTAKPRWAGDLHWSGVQLERWLKMRNQHTAEAREKGAAAAPKAEASYITGRMGGHIKFTGTGRSTADMLASLDGTVAAWVNDGRVSHLAMEAAGLDIAQALGVLVKGDNELPMQCAVTQFTARNGELHADVGIVDTSDTTLLVGGDVSLAKEQLGLVAHADPKDFSPMTLRSPVHLEGSFAQPHVRLEAKPIGLKAVAALALGAVHPLAALIPLIDPGKKAPIGCQQAMERLRGRHDMPVQPTRPPAERGPLTAQAPGGAKQPPRR